MLDELNKIDKKIGFIAGSFDVIHPGYIKAFKQAKQACDFLIVALHKDPSHERAEKIAPLLSLEDRDEILNCIKEIDLVVSYETEKELEQLIRDLNPNIRFLGDDYIDKVYTGQGIAKQVMFLDRSHGWSTTKFKKMIYDNYQQWSKQNDN
jgi:glycerol-3-phosphate cytidylyltransferase